MILHLCLTTEDCESRVLMIETIAEIMIIIEELYSKHRFYDTTRAQIIRIF
jgi:hypothetical protein